MFRVGDQVRLSVMGRKKYGDTSYNPHNGIGIVEDNTPYDYVRWPSGEGNIYREGDLELVVTSLEQMLKECLE